MTDVINWIQSTAFPALSSCWSFFKQCITDLISLVTGSKLVFFFALFLIGAVVSALVWLLTSLPSVESSSDYPVFNTNYRLLGYHDLYYSGFFRPISFIRLYKDKKKQAEEMARREEERKRREEERQHREEERERQRIEGQALADEFFSNNGSRMTVSYNGFKFFAPDWEKRNWGNRHSKRITWVLDSEGKPRKIYNTETVSTDLTDQSDQ